MNMLLILLWLIQPTYIYPALASHGSRVQDFVPEGYSIISQVKGQLNNDTITDFAIIIESREMVVDLKEKDSSQKPRILVILLGNESGGFQRSVQSNESTLLSNEGGIFGDPLDKMIIKNRTLWIKYFGGSSDKWSYAYKWRLQNNRWTLIGATYVSMTGHTNVKEEYDFNLNTGKALYTRSSYYEAEENNQKIIPVSNQFSFGKKVVLFLDNYKIGINKIWNEIYF